MSLAGSMDSWIVYPWRDIPLVSRVEYGGRPIVRMLAPERPSYSLASSDQMPALDVVEHVEFEAREFVMPRGGAEPYRCLVYVTGDEELRRFLRRVEVVGVAVQLLHALADLANGRPDWIRLAPRLNGRPAR